MIKVTILGNNSALPAFGRHPTAQVVAIQEQLFLVDCGEGTQIQLQQFNIRRKRIHYIFISHLHGDHYFGLIGLLSSMALMGRTVPLHIFGPAALKDIIDLQLRVANTTLPYTLHFTAIAEQESKILVDTPHYSVHCFPVMHRISCHGFLFTRKHDPLKLIPEACREYEIPTSFYNRLKKGEDYERRDGLLVRNEWVTAPAPPSKRYAYCADTLYTESFLQHIQGVDMLYHESTYLEDNREKATMRFHSTAAQAATLARKAGVGRLLLGHFSSKYQDLEAFHLEAHAIFPQTTVTTEGCTYEI